MKRLIILAMFIPTTLLAQRGGYGRTSPFGENPVDTVGPSRAWTIGMLSYTGGYWVPTGLDFGMLWRVSRQTGTAAGAWMALGSFTQANAVYFGQSRGFFAGLGLTVRQPIATIFEMGSDRSPMYVRVETAVDAGGSRDFDSPLPQGPWAFRGSFLIGLSLGSRSALGQAFSIMYGPSVFAGQASTTHGLFVLRVRLPAH